MTDCPKCGALSDRQISLVPVIFKGSGWYVNDYGKKKSTLGDAPPSSSDDNHGHSHGDGGHNHTHSHDHDEASASPAAEPSSSDG